MKIRLAQPIQPDSIVDGEGIRTVIWTQGCSHNCPGCHNPETHSFDKGIIKDIEELKEEISNLRNQDGITLSGGDPLFQVEQSLEIAKHAHSIKLNVWCYTGFTFEKLIAMSSFNKKILELLSNIDILIDGPFILNERSLNLKFRGSRNQRIINVKESLKKGYPVLVKKYHREKKYVPIAKKEKHIYI